MDYCTCEEIQEVCCMSDPITMLKECMLSNMASVEEIKEIDEETRKVIKDVAQFEPLDELCNHIFAKRDAHGGSRDHPWVKLKTISSTHTPLDYQLHIPSVPVRHQPLGESLLLFSLVL
uniref:Uncharacterized protein n=1 Tax=Oncorhynchus mykiss TaxID=8022 RepID=A0A8L0DVV8_ONCMY